MSVKETDLFIRADKALDRIALDRLLCHRGYLEAYISRYPEFAATLVPWTSREPVAEIIRDMVDAGRLAGVGPMAAVAGAVAQRVGEDLLSHSREVIVENGGDIFIKIDSPVTVGVYAGKSPLSLRIGVKLSDIHKPIAVCTSSGTVGHSLSYGKADAVCVVSDRCALADAAATAIGNRVLSHRQIQEAMVFGKAIDGVSGLLIIVGEHIGAWGKLELIPLDGGKRG